MNSGMVKKIKGTAVPIPGNDVDTDRIVPARFLKEITFEKMDKYLFFDARFEANGNEKDHPLNDFKYKNAQIMIAGKNFGCGSSREHAAQAILRSGIKAIIGHSFSEIFAGNCKSLGIPTVTVSEEKLDELFKITENKPDTEFEIDLNNRTLNVNDSDIPIEIPDAPRSAFMTGSWNARAMLIENESLVKKTAEDLPYLNGFK
jgi:3-isopropylmalate/(R)-2-methylmalate dehydratase small subunit